MNARQVKACLKARHPAPEWVWAEEFDFGFRGSNRIDGLAMNCFPSRGHMIVGYEVKVSRGDFLHELKHPEKRKQAVEHCDRFYFAVPKGLVKPEEIPLDCGLVECWMGDLSNATPEKNPAPNSRMRLDRWPKNVPARDLPGMVDGLKPRWFMAAIIRQLDPGRLQQQISSLKWELKANQLEINELQAEWNRARKMINQDWEARQEALKIWQKTFPL